MFQIKINVYNLYRILNSVVVVNKVNDIFCDLHTDYLLLVIYYLRVLSVGV